MSEEAVNEQSTRSQTRAQARTQRRSSPTFDSLFTRLLLAQIGLFVLLGAVLGGLFYVERNVTFATLFADAWAEQLASAAGLDAAPLTRAPVQKRLAPPPSARHAPASAPRFAALRERLAARGVPVDEVLIGAGDVEPLVWLHVTPQDSPPVWLGVAGRILVPEWSERALLALALTALLLVGVSWGFTRRLTRPLERLRTRLETHTPTHTPGLPEPMNDRLMRGASPEIVAIATASADLLARLARQDRERAVLLAGVSHDLRSPLGRIRLAAELLPDTEALRPRKASIVRNVGQADRLIESFLDFVRSGELAFDETVDLAAAARTVAGSFERPTDELSVVAPATLPWPNANRLMVERLLANLIDNALKHGRPPVRLTLNLGAGTACIDVDDAGEGMAPHRIAGLTDAFTRGDGSRAAAGSGLGLAIVRQVVLRLGGELSFEHRAEGQRVRVELPV